jgi:hypothetical protein
MLVKGAKVTSTNANSSEGANKTLAELQAAATYTGLGWDFTNTWTIEEGVSFPTLKYGTTTGIQSPKTVNTLQASASNGVLTVKGLVAGEPVRVYTVQGTTIARQVATRSESTINLPATGVYIVTAGNKAVKVVTVK